MHFDQVQKTNNHNHPKMNIYKITLYYNIQDIVLGELRLNYVDLKLFFFFILD